MKKYLFFAAALLFAAISCTKETPDTNTELPDAGKQGGRKTIVLNIAGPDTKTYVSDPDHGIISWEAGDAVGVFTDKDATPIEFALSGAAGTSATFTGEVSEGASKIYVFYPYSADATFADGKITMTLPSEQSVVANNVAKGAMVTVGEATKGGDGSYSARLHNAFSYIKFRITGDDIKEIVLSAGSEKLAGKATFSVADGTMTGTGTVSSIRATKADGYFTKDNYYYIPVLPGSVDALSFSMTSNTHGTDTGTTGFDDWKAERVAGSALTFTRGTGLKFDALDQGTKWNWYFDIQDAASLERFRALVAADKFPAEGVAKFTSDIDLSGETLAAAAGTFKGTLDGQGHSITNWTSNGVSLLNVVGDGTAKSVVKGITLAASCDLNMTVEEQDFGFLAKTVAKASEMTDCHNSAGITATVSETGAKNIGSLVGSSKGKILDCSNSGNIILNVQGSLESTDLIEFGGLIGSIVASTDVSSLTNTGNITVNTVSGGSLGRTEIGGVAGYAGGAYTYSSIENSGNITNNGASSNTVYIGGLFGRYGSATLTSGVNDGAISNAGNVTSVWMGGLFGNIQNVTVNASAELAVLNNGDVSNTGNATEQYIGGIVGQQNNEAGPCSVIGAVNKGAVLTNAPATMIRIGGIIGSAHQPLTLGENTNKASVEIGSSVTSTTVYAGGILGYAQSSMTLTTKNTNEGQIRNSASSAGTVYMAGILAYTSSGATLNNQINEGNITNSGTVTSLLEIGGIVGYVPSGVGSVQNSRNGKPGSSDYGRITNSGVAAVARLAGIVCHIYVNNPLTACDNYGPVKNETRCTGTDDSNPVLMVSGIVAFNQGYAGMTIKDCTNHETATLDVLDAGQRAYVGGIWACGNQRFTLDNCDNHAAINFTPATKMSKQFGLAGIAPKVASNTNFQNCDNTGKITFNGGTSDGGNNYIAGIGGTFGSGAANYSNCSNTGDISVTSTSLIRMGGILAYWAAGTISNCSASCDISLTSTGKDYSTVGGIIGYTAGTSLTGLHFTGTIDASGSTKKVYVGGLLAKSNGASEFNDCSFSGNLVGAAQFVPGLYVGGLQANGYAMTFGATSKCVVAAGSKVNGVEVTSLTKDNLVSQSSDNGTFVSTATLTNIVIE